MDDDIRSDAESGLVFADFFETNWTYHFLYPPSSAAKRNNRMMDVTITASTGKNHSPFFGRTCIDSLPARPEDSRLGTADSFREPLQLNRRKARATSNDRRVGPNVIPFQEWRGRNLILKELRVIHPLLPPQMGSKGDSVRKSYSSG